MKIKKNKKQIKSNIYKAFTTFLKQIEEKEELSHLDNMYFYNKSYKFLSSIFQKDDESDEDFGNRSLKIEKKICAKYTVAIWDLYHSSKFDCYVLVDDMEYSSKYFHRGDRPAGDWDSWYVLTDENARLELDREENPLNYVDQTTKNIPKHIDKNLHSAFLKFLEVLDENCEDPKNMPSAVFLDENFETKKILIQHEEELDDDWTVRLIEMHNDLRPAYVVNLMLDDRNINKKLDYYCVVNNSDASFVKTYYHSNGFYHSDPKGWVESLQNRFMNERPM